MSFSENDRNLRAEAGSKFPIDPSADTEAAFAAVIADALRRDFGSTPAHVKHIARLTGANARTVQNWLHSRNGPSGASLVVLMRHSARSPPRCWSWQSGPTFNAPRRRRGDSVSSALRSWRCSIYCRANDENLR